ncbi:response regulator [Bacillus sp. FSL W8-1122]|uniref:response regulator n=1 Tax=Shouchella clausii TaxID=79880 RepID=UPI00211CFB7A|nr:response regulator [Shouchella clausii]
MLRHALSTKPYQLVTETSPKATLRKVAEERWDLVIADVMMPEMSGLELVKHIRQTYSVSELPILLVTARIQPEDIYAGFAPGQTIISANQSICSNYKHGLRPCSP